MTRKLNAALCFLGTIMVAAICFSGKEASSSTIKLNVFERFRNEMAINHEVAAAKFMNPNALAKWNAAIMPYFKKNDIQLGHFFAFSMVVPLKNDTHLYVVYFNPWVDGALFTQWKKTGKIWKMNNFHLASGERIRGLITSQSKIKLNNIPPIWIWQKGSLLGNIFSYYKDMRARLLNTKTEDILAWFSLTDRERAADLLRVKLRMTARLNSVAQYLTKSRSGPALAGAFSRLKYDALTRNENKLAAYSKDADILADLRPEIIKTFKKNWIFKKGNIYTVILSSIAAPRLFVFMNVAHSGGIEGALLGDLEAMANLQRSAAAPAPLQRSVRKYKAVTGEMVEIITEKRGGKATRTTIVNGKVMEVVTF